MKTPYVGRFAPSPTGPLHAGSLATAIASWLDARAHAGTWLLRIEDLDPPREQPGSAARIVESLARLGLESDRPVVYQSQRYALYREALARLSAAGLAYPCGCTRREIAEAVYPGTCRAGLAPGKSARAWRVRLPAESHVRVDDRACGTHLEWVNREAGDFVLLRADGYWAYQLAVVVDDADQGVTDIVRGEDLLSSTARQRVLQQLLGFPSPRTLHVPVVRNTAGEKLSKQTGAASIEGKPGGELVAAALTHLGLASNAGLPVHRQLDEAIDAWRVRFLS